MTLPDALAWANARMVDRWRMVREAVEFRSDGPPLPTVMGDTYAQMDADALTTLAAAVEAQQQRWDSMKAWANKQSITHGGYIVDKMRELEAAP